jgi:hypothetical protein
VQIFLQPDLYHPSITEISVKQKASGVFFEQTATFGMYMFCLDRAEKGSKGVSLVVTLTIAFCSSLIRDSPGWVRARE